MYEVTKNYVHRKIVDEFILVPVKAHLRQKNNMIVLNPMAALIYTGLVEKKDKQTISKEILTSFDTSEETIENDFEKFTAQLIELEAISVIG